MDRRTALKTIAIGGITSLHAQTYFGLIVDGPPCANCQISPVSAMWYVDSVNGSDSNTGRLDASGSPQPFQTIAKLMAQSILAESTIGFAQGSHWREQFSPDVTIQAVAYGSGAKPLFDASDLISAGAWSKTAGQTLVYQADLLPLDDTVAGDNFVNVWEAGTFLIRATSIANCDATAGTYYPSSDGGATISIYVHASDGSNPATNGKTYEYSRRSFGIQCYPTNCKFYGVETTKNLNLTGSMFLGSGGYMSNCQFSWGSKHCVLVQHGCVLEDCTCLNSYYNTTDTMFVYYETAADMSMSAQFTRCTATQAWQFRGSSVAFFGHAGAGQWGTITYQDCVINSVGTCFSGGQSAGQVINNPTANDCNTLITVSTPTVLTGGTAAMSVHGDECIYLTAGNSITVRGLTAIGGKGGSGFVRTVTEANVSADIQQCTISGFITCVQFFGPALVSLTFAHNAVQAASEFYDLANLPSSFVADFNSFTNIGTGIRAQIGATQYTFAQWQALGYDQNSS